MGSCPCGDQWDVQVYRLSLGQVQRHLAPIAMEFQQILNEPSTGTITLSARDVRAVDVWPSSIGVGIVWHGRRIWAGYVDSIQADSGGTVQLGLVSIDGYLDRRVLSRTLTFNQTPQTAIGAALVNEAFDETGPPSPVVQGIDDGSAILRDRTYNPDGDERQTLGELVRNLTQVRDGPDYRIELAEIEGDFGPAPGQSWAPVMVFQDRVGGDIANPIVSDVHAYAYRLDVDGSATANRVWALGDEPDDDTQPRPIAVAVDPGPAPIYPRWDAAAEFSGVTSQQTLQEQADGLLDLRDSPHVIPGVSIASTDYPPHGFQVGDRVPVRLAYPSGLCFDAPARVIGITWSTSADAADVRDVQFAPVTDAEAAVWAAPCEDQCPECD